MRKLFLLTSIMTLLGTLSYGQSTYYNYNSYGQKQKTGTSQGNYNGGTDYYN